MQTSKLISHFIQSLILISLALWYHYFAYIKSNSKKIPIHMYSKSAVDIVSITWLQLKIPSNWIILKTHQNECTIYRFWKLVVPFFKAYEISDLLIYCFYTLYIINSTANENFDEPCKFPPQGIARIFINLHINLLMCNILR